MDWHIPERLQAWYRVCSARDLTPGGVLRIAVESDLGRTRSALLLCPRPEAPDLHGVS
jgi:hypothetical protein